MSGVNGGLIVGDVVYHTHFGEGVIISLSGSGESAEACVKFKTTFARHFALTWAPLFKVDVKQTEMRELKDTEQTFKEGLSSIEKKYCLSPSNFGGFNLSEDISESDVIAYTRGYGLRHLQELRHAFRELFVPATYAAPLLQELHNAFREHIAPLGPASPPFSPVDVLDIGCGPGLSRFILPEFGITAKTYGGFDYSVNCLWLAREINNLALFNLPQTMGQFVKSLHEIKTSEIHGFVIMNHVLNQPSITESILKVWAGQLKRIYPCGFYLVSVEPKHPEFRAKAARFLAKLREEGITIRNQVTVNSRGEFGASLKAVNWLVCGK